MTPKMRWWASHSWPRIRSSGRRRQAPAAAGAGGDEGGAVLPRPNLQVDGEQGDGDGEDGVGEGQDPAGLDRAAPEGELLLTVLLSLRPAPGPLAATPGGQDRHRSAMAMVTSGFGYSRLEYATTPRWQASTAALAVACTSASSATRAIWRRRSMSCLVTRTKSPGVMSSVASTSSRGSPLAQRWAGSAKPGSSWRVRVRPPASSWAWTSSWSLVRAARASVTARVGARGASPGGPSAPRVS